MKPDERQRLAALPAFDVLNRARRAEARGDRGGHRDAMGSASFRRWSRNALAADAPAALLIGDFWQSGLGDEARQTDLAKAWRQIVRWLVADVPDAGRTARRTAARRRERARAGAGARREISAARQCGGDAERSRAPARAAKKRRSRSPPRLRRASRGFTRRATSRARAAATAWRRRCQRRERRSRRHAATGWTSDLAAAEFRDLKPNRALMEQLARADRRRVLTPDELDVLRPRAAREARAGDGDRGRARSGTRRGCFSFALACFVGGVGPAALERTRMKHRVSARLPCRVLVVARLRRLALRTTARRSSSSPVRAARRPTPTLFAKWAANWRQAGGGAGARARSLRPMEKRREPRQLRASAGGEPKDGAAALWLVLLGHGIVRRRGGEIQSARRRSRRVRTRRVAAAVPAAGRRRLRFFGERRFLKPLAAPGRIVVTATRSGAENNYARFGGYLVGDDRRSRADLDKDGQTSLLEAWLAAAQRTALLQKRGATRDRALAARRQRRRPRHAGGLVSGRARGEKIDGPARARRPARPSDSSRPAVPTNALFPTAARAERDALERELAKLRETKATMPGDTYYANSKRCC